MPDMTISRFRTSVVLASFAAFSFNAVSQTFEVATVRLSPEGDRRPTVVRGGPGTSDPGQATFINVPLANVLTTAFEVRGFQITGPERLSSARYDIVVKVPTGSTKQEFHGMLISLLNDRLHLVFHREPRAIRGYELVLGKKGPRLTTAQTGAAPSSGRLRFDDGDFRNWTGPGC
jgi:uncharacterized protein (TIGR03435 family)